MNVGQQLSDEHSVVRYVSPSKLRRDGDDNVVGVLHVAFELREDESDLSVSWLEFYQGDRSAQICSCVQAQRLAIVVRARSGFAIGNVGKLKDAGQRQRSGSLIRVVFSPSGSNPAHTSVKKLPRDDTALFELLAADVFTELVLNTEVP